ncbi:MAG: hypothetical protein ACMXYL_00305 [Candidatus Woesearchaeota archaeon]
MQPVDYSNRIGLDEKRILNRMYYDALGNVRLISEAGYKYHEVCSNIGDFPTFFFIKDCDDDNAPYAYYFYYHNQQPRPKGRGMLELMVKLLST